MREMVEVIAFTDQAFMHSLRLSVGQDQIVQDDREFHATA